jgi:hypothetical protein
MYKRFGIPYGLNEEVCVTRLSDNASIPFDPANTDYANFKKEILAGAELQDADGNTMTAAEAQEYVATLP